MKKDNWETRLSAFRENYDKQVSLNDQDESYKVKDSESEIKQILEFEDSILEEQKALQWVDIEAQLSCDDSESEEMTSLNTEPQYHYIVEPEFIKDYKALLLKQGHRQVVEAYNSHLSDLDKLYSELDKSPQAKKQLSKKEFYDLKSNYVKIHHIEKELKKYGLFWFGHILYECSQLTVNKQFDYLKKTLEMLENAENICGLEVVSNDFDEVDNLDRLKRHLLNEIKRRDYASFIEENKVSSKEQSISSQPATSRPIVPSNSNPNLQVIEFSSQPTPSNKPIEPITWLKKENLLVYLFEQLCKEGLLSESTDGHCQSLIKSYFLTSDRKEANSNRESIEPIQWKGSIRQLVYLFKELKAKPDPLIGEHNKLKLWKWLASVFVVVGKDDHKELNRLKPNSLDVAFYQLRGTSSTLPDKVQIERIIKDTKNRLESLPDQLS